jgi:gliding motility-associated-like protein
MPDGGQSNGSIGVAATGGTPPYQYSLNGQPFQPNATFTGLGAGNYTITVRDALGCESSVSGNLSANAGALTLVVVDTKSPDCGLENGVIIVAATGGTPPYRYQLNGQGFQPNATFADLAPGSYTVTVRDANGLESTTVQVLTDTAPDIMAEADGPVSVENTATEALRIAVLDNDIWDGGDVAVRVLQAPILGSATVAPDNQIAYQPLPNLVGTDSLVYEVCSTLCAGVCDTAVVYVVVEPGIDDGCDLDYIPPSVVFPQGLTPNGDGLNDVLIFTIVDQIGCPSNYANSDITIFNRWGQRVFVQEPYENSWGGQTFDGKELPAGVYYYTLRIRRQDREDYLYFGDVSIFR